MMLDYLHKTDFSIGEEKLGFKPTEIGNKSTRPGACVACIFSHHPVKHIKMMGRMNSTLEVEDEKEGLLVRTSNQFEIERDIMKENSTRFTLAYSTPFLKSPLLEKIGVFA